MASSLISGSRAFGLKNKSLETSSSSIQLGGKHQNMIDLFREMCRQRGRWVWKGSKAHDLSSLLAEGEEKDSQSLAAWALGRDGGAAGAAPGPAGGLGSRACEYPGSQTSTLPLSDSDLESHALH